MLAHSLLLIFKGNYKEVLMKVCKIMFTFAKVIALGLWPVALFATMEQINCEADADLTRRIRASLINDKSLSVRAKNIKIHTQKGITTLSGPVASDEEKIKIEAFGQSIPGKRRNVKNNLHIIQE